MNTAIKKHRLTLTVGLACALVAAWYLFIQEPYVQKASQLTASLNEINSRLNMFEQDLGTAEQIANRSRSLQQTWDGLTIRLVCPESADEILQQIREAATRHGITVLDIDLDLEPILKQLSEPAYNRPLSRVQVSLEGRGRYFNIGEFLHWLQSDITIAEIDEVQIHYRKVVDPEVYFSVAAEAFVK